MECPCTRTLRGWHTASPAGRPRKAVSPLPRGPWGRTGVYQCLPVFTGAGAQCRLRFPAEAARTLRAFAPPHEVAGGSRSRRPPRPHREWHVPRVPGLGATCPRLISTGPCHLPQVASGSSRPHAGTTQTEGLREVARRLAGRCVTAAAG